MPNLSKKKRKIFPLSRQMYALSFHFPIFLFCSVLFVCTCIFRRTGSSCRSIIFFDSYVVVTIASHLYAVHIYWWRDNIMTCVSWWMNWIKTSSKPKKGTPTSPTNNKKQKQGQSFSVRRDETDDSSSSFLSFLLNPFFTSRVHSRHHFLSCHHHAPPSFYAWSAAFYRFRFFDELEK